MNNIGALALWVPIALSLCRSTGVGTRKGADTLILCHVTRGGGYFYANRHAGESCCVEHPARGGGQALRLFRPRMGRHPGDACGLDLADYRCAAPPSEAGPTKHFARIESVRPFFTELRVTAESPLAGLSASQVASQLRGTIYSHLRDDRHVFGAAVTRWFCRVISCWSRPTHPLSRRRKVCGGWNSWSLLGRKPRRHGPKPWCSRKA